MRKSEQIYRNVEGLKHKLEEILRIKTLMPEEFNFIKHQTAHNSKTL